MWSVGLLAVILPSLSFCTKLAWAPVWDHWKNIRMHSLDDAQLPNYHCHQPVLQYQNDLFDLKFLLLQVSVSTDVLLVFLDHLQSYPVNPDV